MTDRHVAHRAVQVDPVRRRVADDVPWTRHTHHSMPLAFKAAFSNVSGMSDTYTLQGTAKFHDQA